MLWCQAIGQRDWRLVAACVMLTTRIARGDVEQHPCQRHVGVWNENPKNVPSALVPDGPILGNGDLGATLSGATRSGVCMHCMDPTLFVHSDVVVNVALFAARASCPAVNEAHHSLDNKNTGKKTN